MSLPPSGEASAQPLTRRRRLSLTFTLLGLYGLYFPINQLLQGADRSTLTTSFDLQVPLSPSWMLVYGGIYFIGLAPLLLIQERESFQRLIWAGVIVELVSLSLFLLFPVQMELRPLNASGEGLSFTAWLLQLCYFLDPPNCCFPSLHVSVSWLAALSVLTFHQRIGSFLVIIAALISASTLLVKQHYIADVVAGAVLAAGAWSFILWRCPLSVEQRSAAIPTGRPGYPVLIAYGLAVTGSLCLWSLDWLPWLTRAVH